MYYEIATEPRPEHSMNIFTYGSLMYAEIWNKVVRGKHCRENATVSGFAVRKVRGESYPGMIRSCPGSNVRGVVYFDVSEGDLALLDRFEGEYYERITTACFLSFGRKREAGAYLFRAEFRHMLERVEWSPSCFGAAEIRKMLVELD
jgi:gamma-glutamylcyclotransferase (GGCT)/AIG2-like uncharacterized protein YtfP